MRERDIDLLAVVTDSIDLELLDPFASAPAFQLMVVPSKVRLMMTSRADSTIAARCALLDA